MRFRRAATLLLAALLFIGGVSCGLHFVGDAGRAAEAGMARGSPAEVNTHVTRNAEFSRRPLAFVQAVALRVSDRLARVFVTRAEEAALIGEMSQLHLLAEDSGLELNPAQWERFAAVTLQLQAVRQEFEAQIAHVTAVAPGRYQVEIPDYAAAGGALRRKFYATLGAELGEAVAADIADRLGGGLEGYFGGFGVSRQTLEVSAPSGGAAEVEVTRTITYVKDLDGAPRVITRRETVFPGWEDPAGERWGALLARLRARAG